MQSNNPILEVKGLWAGYGKLVVVRDLSLSLERGTTTLILGLNGAGKTTTLKTIAGILPAIKGSVTFEGKDVTHTPSFQRARMGLVMITDNPVFPDMTVSDNIKLAARTGDSRVVQEAVKYFPELSKFLSFRAASLSGGQRKMLAMAMAMVSKPKVLLLDEPSTGLSPLMVSKVVGYVKLLKSLGITILLAEQNPSFISVADYVMVMEMGRAKIFGRAEEVGKLEDVRKTFFQVT
ncbi:ABC transporter ATP-binding protein [Acidilobus saccharovorans]|uniref:ABC transporter ATP-binding protein n=1 Tax=Acidilobus saccharovorans TaxID=242703 RepID=UPI000AE2D887|nr:ABC transporter ATP-binding protein [Acidilobus saccharovorans]